MPEIINVGMHLLFKQNSNEYRVIYIKSDIAELCQINTTKLVLAYYPCSQLSTLIRKQEVIVVNDENIIIDKNNLKESQKKTYARNAGIIKKINDAYGPTYQELSGHKPKAAIDEILADKTIKRNALWRLITRYLQSGMKDSSLIDSRTMKDKSKEQKSGRPPLIGKSLEANDYANFDEAIKAYLSSAVSTYQDAYDDMIDAHYYHEAISLGDEKIPTYAQFYQYAHKTIKPEQRAKAKQGEREVFNNNRIRTGSAMTDVRGPGDMVEIDAHECDCSLVSVEYPNSCVGRPILYIAIDVYTRTILAAAVAMDNNSVVGLTNCFANLVEDKEALLKRFGLSIAFNKNYSMDNVWPTGWKPTQVRYDRGSDFISKDIERILAALNITPHTEPGATGSMKGIVERIFKDVEYRTNRLLEDKGLIRKVYDSQHHEHSCIDINDYAKMIVNYIIYHNTNNLKDYRRHADMIEKGVMPKPCELWKYGMEHADTPHKIASKEQFLYDLMIPRTAKISKRGIALEGLVYLNANDQELCEKMFRLQNNTESLPVRMDPRDIGHLYYLHQHQLQTAVLNPLEPNYEGFIGMSYKRFKELKQRDKADKKTMEDENLKNRIDLNRRNKPVVDAKAPRAKHKSDTKNMRENRELEKAQISAEHSFASKFALDQENHQKAKTEVIERAEEQKALKEKEIQKQISHSSKLEKGDTTADIQRKMEENARSMFDDDDE